MRQYHLENDKRYVQSYYLLLLMINRKLHIRFRLVARSMTLDDLELLYISSNFRRISRNFADLTGNNC